MRQLSPWIAGEDYCKQGEKQGHKIEGRSMADVSKEQADQGGWAEMRQSARRGIQMVTGALDLRTNK